jgi:tRNA threonylcarbamoyladenosine biosynthesis protein TsaB
LRNDVKNLMILDTSTLRAAIGVLTREGRIHTATSNAGRQHGRDLIPCIRAILGEAHVEIRDIEVIGVGLGPGSYTGLRVGVMAAKTIAYATGAKLVGLDTLEAVAYNAPSESTRIAVIADAQRGDLYVAEWARDSAGGPLRSILPCQVEPMVAWLRRLEPSVAVLGPALESPAIRAAISPAHRASDPGSNFPDSRHLIELALRAQERGVFEDVWSLEPRYLRRSSAEEKWESRGPER